MTSNLQNIGKRIDNLKKVILKENSKDLWVIEQIHPLFIQLINNNISEKQENHLIFLLEKILDNYLWRFNSTFEHKTLTSYLLEGLLPEKKKVVAVYGGGFKPPTSGHFEVVQQALKENPEIDEFIILIGGKPRNGITPDESILIWDIYKQYLPYKVEVKYTSVPPIKGIYNYAKEHPDEEVLFIIGAREGNEEDFKDIASRTTSLDKYPNLNLRTIVTTGGVSGTAARNASKISLDKFKNFVPSELSDEEVEEVFNIVANKIQEKKEINTSITIETLLEEEDQLMAEIVNPDGEHFQYEELNIKGLYTYEDSRGNLYFARIFTQPTNPPHFEFKVGWFEDNSINKPKYEPQLPPNAIGIDNLKRRNTIAKIYRDEIIPYFKEKSSISNFLIINPISDLRYTFSKRLVQNWTPKDLNIQYDNENRKFIKINPVQENKPQDGKAAPYGSGYDEVEENVNFVSLEKILDDMFEDLGIDINFTRHFKERVIERGLTEEDIIELMKKIYDTHGDEVADLGKDENRVFTHLRRLVDIAAINKGYGEDYLKDLVLKTAYKRNSLREPEFRTNRSSPKLRVNENASYSQQINIIEKIAELTNYMIKKGMNIEPLPSMEFIDGDSENAKDFFGKTAYYDPNRKHIVLYTEGRHPKDIVRSYAHEMIHHIQNLEDRLGDISTTNTQEDDNLNDIEAEANLKGTMTFRNWTDSLNENLKEGKQVGLLYHSTYPSTLKTILDQNILKGNLATYNGKDVLAISTTRNKNFKYDGRKAQIVLDGDKLSTKYKIKPFDYWGRSYNRPKNSQAQDEDEEIILTSKINNIKDYIVDINLDKPLNEAIVGDKIECDNCGWSWNIVDGGDDLFICHKCGHDNEPVNEKKNKDPFGLNAYARELAMGLEENEKVMDYKIYCDMDGVIADFERGYEELTGIDLQGEFKPEGKEFWGPISKAGVGFWAGLKWMPDGQQLWDYIKPFNPQLLSAPSREQSSRIGKHVWVKHKIPGTRLILRYANKKKELASPESILIDDRQANIDQWEAAGGIGILHTSAANTISQLKKLGL